MADLLSAYPSGVWLVLLAAEVLIGLAKAPTLAVGTAQATWSATGCLLCWQEPASTCG